MTMATLQPLMDATTEVKGNIVWKVVAQSKDGRTVFLRFGTPATYSRFAVRDIAHRLVERAELVADGQTPLRGPRIRRDDTTKGPWVPLQYFNGKNTVGEAYGQLWEDEVQWS